MMIRPVIDPVFSPYGVVRENPGEPETVPIPISQRNPVPLYCYSRDTHWDYGEGMTVLLIREQGILKRFYLDRAVTIYAGVCFGFYPLSPDSTVSGESTLLQESNCVGYAQRPATPPDSRRPEIFTLFPQSGRDGLYFRGERHPPLELVYLEKGVLHNYCEGQEQILHPGELLLFGQNQWHMQYSDEQVQFLTLSFLWEDHDFTGLTNRVIAAPAEIQQSIHSLLREYSQRLPNRDAFISAHVELLLLQILRLPVDMKLHKKPSPTSERMHRGIIDEAVQIISNRIYGKLTVPELAAAVNVSASQLTALFQEYLGVAPAKYITRIRLEESKTLLANRQLSVGDVARQLGYSSIQHFSKQFSAWFGYPPSACAKKEG